MGHKISGNYRRERIEIRDRFIYASQKRLGSVWDVSAMHVK